jgi:hypothetical protein
MVLQLDRIYVTNIAPGKNGAGYLEATDGGEAKIKLYVPNFNAADWPIFTPLKVVARITPRLFGRDLSIRVDQYQVDVLEAAS